MYFYLPDKLVVGARLTSVSCFIIFSFQINKYSIIFLILSILSLYFLKKKNKTNNLNINFTNLNQNPFKSKSNKTKFISQLPQEKIEKIKNELFDFYFFQDYSNNLDNLKFFQEIKSKSDCLFAKNSSIWSGPNWNLQLSIEQNIELLILPSFLIFTNLCEDLKLDGYLIRLPGHKFGHDLELFAKTFCAMLKHLSSLDPSNKNCINSNIDSSKWVFEFNNLTFFITTFLPLYPETNSRYTFGIDQCFVLFQPEISFAIHNLPPDTPHTNWQLPKTVRDKIRIQFKSSNREYLIRDTIYYPMAHDIIKPLNKHDPIINWWKYL